MESASDPPIAAIVRYPLILESGLANGLIISAITAKDNSGRKKIHQINWYGITVFLESPRLNASYL